MRVEHRSVDGSEVRLDGDTDLSMPATSLGTFRLRSGLAHQFEGNPPGRVWSLWQSAQALDIDYQVHDGKHTRVRGGDLLTVTVSHATQTGERRQLTVAIWEGKDGAIVSSCKGHHLATYHEELESIPYTSTAEGSFIELPIMTRPRPASLLKTIPNSGLLAVSPLIRETLEKLPRRRRGHRVRGGELYRLNRRTRALALKTRSALAHVDPQRHDDNPLLAAAELDIDWKPRR